MNKKIWIILIIILIIIVFAFCFFTKNNNNNSNTENENTPYEANKTSSNLNTTENEKQTNSSDTINQSTQGLNSEQQSSNTELSNSNTNSTPTPQIVEQQISTFTTKIYSQDSARQNNISITCKTLNGITVKNGATFSFCSTVGPSTTSKGYQEADIYDNNGNKKKGLGGGNCQISTTLYNAALAVPSIKITERHAHSNKVPYVSSGKDAAVAYGSYDFKFVNNTGNDIKILSQASKTAVTVSIISLKVQ